MELLKQDQYAPMEVVDQILSIFAGTTGGLDEIPVAAVKKFETEFLAYIRSSHAKLRARIDESKDLGDQERKDLTQALADFKTTFTP